MPGDVADGDGGAGVIGVPSFSVTAVGTEGVSPLSEVPTIALVAMRSDDKIIAQ